jgi:excisionase family DNA binding protein
MESKGKLEQLLSMEDVCSILGISRNTLYSWLYKHKVTCIKVGRLNKFQPSYIEGLIRDNTVEARESLN